MLQYIGVDAGATWIKAGLFSADLKPVRTIKVASGARASASDYFASVAHAVRTLDVPEAVVGLALPAHLDEAGEHIAYMVNVPGLGIGSEGISIRQAFTELSDIPLVAYNDAACAAMGEWWQGHGAADPTVRLLHITWGTGVGTGFVSEGKPHYGWQGGHILVSASAEAAYPCNCGSAQDLEAFIAIPHLVHYARDLVATGKLPTKLTAEDFADEREVSKKIKELMADGDEVATRVCSEALGWLARGIQTMSVICYPTLVTVGGGMELSPELLKILREHLTRSLGGVSSAVIRPDQVTEATLGNEAGMYGAAYLAHAHVAGKV